MAINVSNVGQVAVAPQLNELKKSASYTKTNAMPMDSVSFGNGDESEKKSNAGKIAAIVGGVALAAGAIYALTRGKTKPAQEVAEAGAKAAQEVAGKAADEVAEQAGKVADEVAETVENVVKKDKSKMEIVKDSNGQLSRTHYYKLGEDGKAVETTTYFYGKDGFLEKATVRNGHFGEPISKIKYSKFDDGQGNIIVKAHEQKVGSNEWTVTNVGTVKKPVAKTDIASKGDVKSAEDSAKAMQEAWAKSNTEPEQVTNV